jgi:hypothetical protein
MNERFVTVARFTDYMEANLAKQRLEDEGINVVITGENVASVYTAMPGIADVELQTPQSQAARAREILDSMASERAKGSQDEDFERDDIEEPQDGFEDEDGSEEQE